MSPITTFTRTSPHIPQRFQRRSPAFARVPVHVGGLSTLLKVLLCCGIGRHLVGVWIGGVWNRHFPESKKYFSEAEICRKINLQENRQNSAERAIFAKFQAPKFENSEPEKMQFHTPSHSIPPLDSLLWEAHVSCLGPSWLPCSRGT